MKEKILGGKKQAPEPTIIEDPESGLTVDSPSKIKEVSLRYCVSPLTNRMPKKGYEDITLFKKTIHEKMNGRKVP